MPLANLAYDNLGFSVVSDDAGDLPWLRAFLAPAFAQETEAAGSPPVRVHLHRDDAAVASARALTAPPTDLTSAFVLDAKVDWLPCRRAPTGELTAYDAFLGTAYMRDHEITIYSTEPAPRHRRGALMRVVREVAMDREWRRGRTILHGSAFVWEGSAVVLVGAKHSGKTSLLTAVLAGIPGVGYLANDRVVLHGEGGSTWVVGMPTLVSVRPGSQLVVPGLAERLAQVDRTGFGMARPAPREESAAPPERLVLAPHQLAAAFAVPMVRQAPLRAIVHCTIDDAEPTFRLRRLSPAETRSRGVDVLLGAAHLGTASELFGHAEHGPFPDATALRSRLGDAIEQVPNLELTMGPGLYAPRMLQEWLAALQ